MKKILAFCAGGMLLLAANAALAAPGFTTTTVNLRAGPDTDYPSVGVLPPGIDVSIEGCIDGWSWCDVIVDGDRGWVAGDFLQYEYDNRRVYVREYGPRVGIPFVTFTLGNYWNTYYSHRNYVWYNDRDRWDGWRHGRPAPAVYRYSPRVYSRTVYVDHGGRNDRYDHNDHRNDRYDHGRDDHRYDRGHDDHRNDHNDRGHDDHRNDHNDRSHDDHRNDHVDHSRDAHRDERNDRAHDVRKDDHKDRDHDKDNH